MTIKYETEIQGKNRTIEDPDLVDIMKVRGKIRYADEQGGQGSMESGRILGATGGKWKVIVRTPSGREEYPCVGYAGIEDGDVFLSGNGLVENLEDSEIIRIRNLSV